MFRAGRGLRADTGPAWVGSGFVGQVAHLAYYAEMPEAEVVALAELRPKLGAEVCQRYGIPRHYESHTALLEDTEVEAVVAVEKEWAQ